MRKSGIALAVGLCVGLFLSFVSSSIAARNAGGTMSLATGNPVVTGTVISSSVFNATMTDIKNEITNSLDRNGRGAMLAALQSFDGTVAAPGLTFSGDLNTGLYRIGIDNPAIAAGGVKAQEWTATTTVIPVAVTASNGITVTNATANGTAVTATGNGTGRGITSTGGASGGAAGLFTGSVSGNGLEATGGTGTGNGVVATGGSSGTGGKGLVAQGSGSGDGIQSTGGTTGRGVVGVGGATSGTGGKFTGGPASVGVEAWNGTDATAAVRRDALSVSNGDLDMSSVVNPSSTTAISERLTPMNIPKAWALINIVGSGTQTVQAGFNIASIACASSSIQVTFASAFASTNYAVIPAGSNNARIVDANRNSTTRVDFQFRDNAGTLLDPCGLFAQDLYFVAFGAQ